MASVCERCGKKRNIAWRLVKLRGKYNPTVKRVQKPNLQWAKLPSGRRLVQAGFGPAKAGKRVKICTKCKKSLTRT